MMKKKNINIRVSDEEYARIKSNASTKNMTVSEYMIETERQSQAGVCPKLAVRIERMYSIITDSNMGIEELRFYLREEANKLWSLLNS